MPAKRLLTAALLFLAFTSPAQDNKKYTVPDYTNIEKVTHDKNSKTYYPTLLGRYMANDTTLTNEEMNLLYYGSFSNDIAKPFSGDNYRDSIKAIYKKEELTDADKKKLTSFYLLEHKATPFDLNTLNALCNLYQYLHDPLEASYVFKLKAVFNTIESTGDGMTVKSGFHVNSIADEYAVLAILGFNFGGTQSLVQNCDYLEVEKNDYNVKGLYFNVEQIFAGYNKMFSNSDLKDSSEKTNKGTKKK